MTGYKAIVKNIIISKVEDYLKKQTGHFCSVCDNECKVELDKELGYPSWEIDTEIRNSGMIVSYPYHIYGYISQLGTVHIVGVRFSRTYCKRNEDGSFGKEYTKRYYINDEELKTFKFDI